MTVEYIHKKLNLILRLVGCSVFYSFLCLTVVNVLYIIGLTRLKAPIDSAHDAAYSLITCKTLIILNAQWNMW